MKSEEGNQTKGMSRRGFLKTAGALGAAGALASLAKIPGVDGVGGEANAVTVHNEIPLEIAENYQRYDFKNVTFMRCFYDPKLIDAGQKVIPKFANQLPQPGNPGYTELDAAFFMAAWSVHDSAATGDCYGFPQAGSLYKWDVPSNTRVTTFESPEEASQIVKKASEFLGADLVGICDYDERWVYSNWYDPFKGESTPVDFGFKPKSVIVLALEMDYEAFKTAPSLIEMAATGNQYSNMAVVSHKVATFLRQLGYKAANCGNDSAISIPLAVAAGLGELSRMGILVTKKYGPRVRLCKVFTDLELKADKPITFGVQEFCKVCLKCADNCPSKAISHDKEPSYETKNISNNPGVKKWCVDAEKCFEFWGENGGDCGSCIACCPYNKIEEWHHELAALATNSPARPLLRYLDEAFGYGKVSNEAAIANYWNKKL